MSIGNPEDVNKMQGNFVWRSNLCAYNCGGWVCMQTSNDRMYSAQMANSYYDFVGGKR